jgi:arabinogalactan oligomer/maltooligosaccharide transport system permease protein
MNDTAMYTAPVGLRFFVNDKSSQWGYFSAGSIIVSIPVVFLFLFLQKYLVSGLTAGSVKG